MSTSARLRRGAPSRTVRPCGVAPRRWGTDAVRLMRTAFVVAMLGVAAVALAGCGRAGQPELPNGKRKPQLVVPPNAVAVTKEERPYGDKWDYPHRRGVFQIDPPPREPKKPDRPFFLDFLL